jgi:hypothetical protein
VSARDRVLHAAEVADGEAGLAAALGNEAECVELLASRDRLLAEAWPEWNPRYVAYAASNDRTPPEQMAADRERPGRCTGFIAFISRELAAFRKAHPDAFTSYGLINHDGFDAWLSAIHHSPEDQQKR